jgi:hypothetical protein
VILKASIVRNYVTRQGTNVLLPDGDRNVETCRSIRIVVIYTAVILMVRLLGVIKQ